MYHRTVAEPLVDIDLYHIALELMVVAFAGKGTPREFKSVLHMLCVPSDREEQLRQWSDNRYPLPVTQCAVPRERSFEIVAAMQRILRGMAKAFDEMSDLLLAIGIGHFEVSAVYDILTQHYPFHILELQVEAWRRQLTTAPTPMTDRHRQESE